MGRGRRHTPEQIVRKLGEADQLLAEGQDAATVAKLLGRRSRRCIGGVSSTAD